MCEHAELIRAEPSDDVLLEVRGQTASDGTDDLVTDIGAEALVQHTQLDHVDQGDVSATARADHPLDLFVEQIAAR